MFFLVLVVLCHFLVIHEFLNIPILTFIFNSDMGKKNIDDAHSSPCMCDLDFSGIL